MTVEEEDQAAVTVLVVNLIFIFILLVLYVLTINATTRKIALYIPPATILILLGLILGAILTTQQNIKESLAFSPEIFFNLLLPPIIFNAGYSLDKRNFFRNLGSILTFAFVGTLISCFFIGVMLYYVNTDFQMTLTESMSLGSLISAVDPVSTMAVFREVGIHPNLYNIVFGESILNDAVSIVINRVFNDLAEKGSADAGAAEIFMALGWILLIGVVSIFIGIVFGLFSALIHKHSDLRNHPPLELAMALNLAYLSYSVSEAIHMSGIMALLFTGILMDHYTYYNLSAESRASTKSMFDMLAHLSEAFVFLYLGMAAFTVDTHNLNVFNVGTTLVWCVLGRCLHVLPLAFLLNLKRKYKIDKRQQLILCLSGIRGAVAFALALDSSVYVDVFVTTTLIIVFITTLVFGGATYPTIRWLNMVSKEVEEEEVTAPSQSHHWFLQMDEQHLKRIFRRAGATRECPSPAPIKDPLMARSEVPEDWELEQLEQRSVMLHEADEVSQPEQKYNDNDENVDI